MLGRLAIHSLEKELFIPLALLSKPGTLIDCVWEAANASLLEPPPTSFQICRHIQNTIGRKGIPKAFFRLPRVRVQYKALERSKPTYACQHATTDWLAGKVLQTDEMSTRDHLSISWTCVEPSLWALSTFFCCNASGFQIDLYVVDICLFLGRLQLHQISLKDDTSLVSEHNIIASRFLTKSGTP